MSGSGISWAVCKSAPCSRQITTPAPHHSVFYRPCALPATQPSTEGNNNTVPNDHKILLRCVNVFSLLECNETSSRSSVVLCMCHWMPWLHIPAGLCSGPAVHDDSAHILLLRLCSKVICCRHLLFSFSAYVRMLSVPCKYHDVLIEHITQNTYHWRVDVKGAMPLLWW